MHHFLPALLSIKPKSVKIKRTLATHIMSRAISLSDQSLTGIITPNGALQFIDDVEQINQTLHKSPDSILIYNQSRGSSQIKDQIQHYDGQRCIEIFQDTRGVFGLRAYLQIGKMQTPVKLELDDNEDEGHSKP